MRRQPPGAAVALAALCASVRVPVTLAFGPTAQCTLLPNLCMPAATGVGFASKAGVDVAGCCSFCGQHSAKCVQWTLNHDKAVCHLWDAAKATAAGNCTSGNAPGRAPNPPAPPGPPPPPPRPSPAPTGAKDVLFVMVDDLRPEIGAYGARHVSTPNMDTLSASSTVFERM